MLTTEPRPQARVVGEVFLVYLFFLFFLHEFGFCVWCGDFKMFVSWIFLGNLKIFLHWAFLTILFDKHSLVSVLCGLFLAVYVCHFLSEAGVLKMYVSLWMCLQYCVLFPLFVEEELLSRCWCIGSSSPLDISELADNLKLLTKISAKGKQIPALYVKLQQYENLSNLLSKE